MIGADSFVTTNAGPGANACKIAQEGATYFALSGLAEDRSSGYDLIALARQAAKETENLPATLARFTELVRVPLTESVARLKLDSPADYRLIEEGRPIVQVIFAEAGRVAPRLAVASFQMETEGSLREYASVLADEFDTRGPRIVYVGQQGKIRDYLQGHREWYRSGKAALIRDLIQLEIDVASGHVGPPVDILAIRPGVAGWVQRKEICEQNSP